MKNYIPLWIEKDNIFKEQWFIVKDLENEIWKPITLFNGIYKDFYQVSNFGRILKLEYFDNLNRHHPSFILHYGIRAGYFYVRLTINGVANTCFVHKCVATEFCLPNNVNKKQVNHKNGDKTDNRFNNLEWVTPSENIQHSLSTGLHGNHVIVQCVETGQIFNSIAEAARYENVSTAVIRKNIKKLYNPNYKRTYSHNYQIVEKICNSSENRQKFIHCIEDDLMFENIHKTAKYYGITDNGVRCALDVSKSHVCVKLNKTFEYVDKSDTYVNNTSKYASKHTAVLCLEDNKNFFSCVEASKCYNVSPDSIRHNIKVNSVLNENNLKQIPSIHKTFIKNKEAKV